MCEEKRIVGGKRQKNFLFYFIMEFILFYWVVCTNKNWDVRWVVKWISKIDKLMFEDANKFFFFFSFSASLDASALRVEIKS